MIECRTFDVSFFDNAPEKFVFEREINTTPEGLFEVLEDENSWPIWGTGIAKVDWTSPKPFQVGTTRTVTFHGGGMEVYEVFIAWEQNREMAFCLTGATQKVWWSFGEHYLVEDLGNGRCKLRWTVAYEPRFVFAKIHRFVKPMMKFWLGMLADNLVKYVLEQPQHAAAAA